MTERKSERAELATELAAISGRCSAHPHASDCEKQGETMTWDMGPNGWVTIRPSDRPADVTVEDLAYSIAVKANPALLDWETELAVELIDAFTVGRR